MSTLNWYRKTVIPALAIQGKQITPLYEAELAQVSKAGSVPNTLSLPSLSHHAIVACACTEVPDPPEHIGVVQRLELDGTLMEPEEKLIVTDEELTWYEANLLPALEQSGVLLMAKAAETRKETIPVGRLAFCAIQGAMLGRLVREGGRDKEIQQLLTTTRLQVGDGMWVEVQ